MNGYDLGDRYARSSAVENSIKDLVDSVRRVLKRDDLKTAELGALIELANLMKSQVRKKLIKCRVEARKGE